MSADLCGYTVVDRDGIEGPCDLPATGWRWYQDVEHEDTLDAACDLRGNEGGRRIKALEEVREALADSDLTGGDQAYNIRLTLRSRMGADWLNGRETS